MLTSNKMDLSHGSDRRKRQHVKARQPKIDIESFAQWSRWLQRLVRFCTRASSGTPPSENTREALLLTQPN